MNFDLLLLGLAGTPMAVGLYAAVSRVIMLLREFGSLYYLSLFPALSRAAKEATSRFVTLGHAAIRHAAAIAFPLVVGGCLTGPELLSFVFSPEYAPAAHAFSLLLIATAFAILTGVYRFGLISYNRQKTFFRIVAAGTVLNVIMNLFLIPRYSLIGAGYSAVASEAVICVLTWWAVARSVALSPWKPLIRPALATAGMVLIFWLLPAFTFVVTVGIAAASYGVLALLFGAVYLRELVEVWRLRAPAAVEHAGASTL